MMTDDVQSVDEISRRWVRGRQAVEEYFRQVGPAVEDIRSELKDVREAVWGNSGMVTCWMEQDYTYQGKRQHVAAPTTIVLRRIGSEWKAALHHSVPLPESASLRGCSGGSSGTLSAHRTHPPLGSLADLAKSADAASRERTSLRSR